MKLFKILLLFCCFNCAVSSTYAQANPYIAVLPENSGLVNLGATLNLQITIGNTGSTSIAAFKLRPVITVPAIVNFLPDAAQLTGLPAGWSIVSNSGSQIRICNGTDVIAGNTSRTIILKVQGVTIGGPITFSGQLNFGGASCAVAGPAPSGNNTADDFATSTIQVVAGCSLAVTATSGNILCSGGSTTITASSTGIAGIVEYGITGTISVPFQTSNTFTVPAGTYTVTARDAANPLTCIATTSIVITEPTPIPDPTINVLQPNCTQGNGIVTVTSSTTGLTFSIDGGAYVTYPSGGFLLTTGAHTIQAKNTNGCLTQIINITINVQPTTPTAPVVGTITQPNCSVSTGSVVLNGLPSGDWVINPGAISGNTSSTTINNLAANNYTFTLTNAVGCTSIASTNVIINPVLDAPTTPIISITQPTCTVATGTIVITSPTTDLTFSLDGGLYAPYPTGGYTGITSGNHTLIAQNISGCLSPLRNFTINAQPASPPAAVVNITQPTCTVATATIAITSPTTGLTFSLDGGAFNPYPTGGYITTPGTHTIATQNTSGCAATITNIIVNAQPASPTVSASTSLITCFGGSSTITASSTGGVLPYEYSLNSGSFQTVNTFTVGAGTYTLTVKGANGCTGTSNNIVVTQPTPITASTTVGDIACSGGNTTLTIVATGGTGAYEYRINNGSFQPINIFNVGAGIYTATVRLAANPACSTSATTPITITQPDSLKAKTTALVIAKCGGLSTITVTAQGGKQPYTGTGGFTREPGKWKFTVTDANACTSTSEVTILPPGCVDIKIFPNPAQNIITINHSEALQNACIQVYTLTGKLVLKRNIPPYSFVTKMDVSKLTSGLYVLVYTNANERKETKLIKFNSK